MASDNNSEFSVVATEGQLKLGLPEWFHEAVPKEGKWEAKALSKSCVVLRNRSSASPLNDEPTALLKIPSELLKDVLEGLFSRRWSGVIGIDAGLGQQKIYLTDGELTFASSTLMDHRLGEVIYRNGDISLEKLTESAVKVTRSVKFGQVLLRDATFSSVDLWRALRQQILQITRTVFLAPEVYIEMKEGKDLAPTAIVFPESSRHVVHGAYYFGCMFRNFMEHVSFDSAIKINETALSDLDAQRGTFESDLVDLIRENGDVKAVMKASKLHDVNTLVSIMDMVTRGVCEIESMREVKGTKAQAIDPYLQSRLDSYSFVVRKAKVAFGEQNIAFPSKDLKAFALRLNVGEFVSLYLTDEGDVHQESIHWMACQCVNNSERAKYFANHLESLTQFLLQAAGDILPYEAGKQVKEQFKQLRA